MSIQWNIGKFNRVGMCTLHLWVCLIILVPSKICLLSYNIENNVWFPRFLYPLNVCSLGMLLTSFTYWVCRKTLMGGVYKWEPDKLKLISRISYLYSSRVYIEWIQQMGTWQEENNYHVFLFLVSQSILIRFSLFNI